MSAADIDTAGLVVADRNRLNAIMAGGENPTSQRALEAMCDRILTALEAANARAEKAEWELDAQQQLKVIARELAEALEARLATERDARLAETARVAVLEKALEDCRIKLERQRALASGVKDTFPFEDRRHHKWEGREAGFCQSIEVLDVARAALQSTPTSETSNG